MLTETRIGRWVVALLLRWWLRRGLRVCLRIVLLPILLRLCVTVSRRGTARRMVVLLVAVLACRLLYRTSSRVLIMCWVFRILVLSLLLLWRLLSILRIMRAVLGGLLVLVLVLARILILVGRLLLLRLLSVLSTLIVGHVGRQLHVWPSSAIENGCDGCFVLLAWLAGLVEYGKTAQGWVCVGRAILIELCRRRLLSYEMLGRRRWSRERVEDRCGCLPSNLFKARK